MQRPCWLETGCSVSPQEHKSIGVEGGWKGGLGIVSLVSLVPSAGILVHNPDERPPRLLQGQGLTAGDSRLLGYSGWLELLQSQTLWFLSPGATQHESVPCRSDSPSNVRRQSYVPWAISFPDTCTGKTGGLKSVSVSSVGWPTQLNCEGVSSFSGSPSHPHPPPQQTQGSSICLLPQLLPCCDDVVPFFSTCDPSQGAFLKSSLHTQGLKQRWASFHSLSHTAHTDLVLTLSQALEIGAE